jgi:hypothetical protein
LWEEFVWNSLVVKYYRIVSRLGAHLGKSFEISKFLPTFCGIADAFYS